MTMEGGDICGAKRSRKEDGQLARTSMTEDGPMDRFQVRLEGSTTGKKSNHPSSTWRQGVKASGWRLANGHNASERPMADINGDG